MAYTLTLQERQDWKSRMDNLAQAGSLITIKPLAANYTLTTNDYRKLFSVSGNRTITLPNAATVINGYHAFIKNNGSGTITLQCAIANQKIDNELTRNIYPNEAIMVIGNSTQWYTFHAGSFIIP